MKNVLVTGGSRGIGKCIVQTLSHAGYNVVYTYNKSAPLDNMPANVTCYKHDVNDSDSANALLNDLDIKGLYPQILVNNAGITCDSMFSKMTFEQWSTVLNTNLLSCYHLTKPIFDRMRTERFGRIVNISSVNASKGQIGQANYCASKAGLLGLTRALALEGARYGITVNSLSPGYTATEMVMAIREDVRDKIVSQIPLSRLGEAEEIAKSLLFLISDDASYINGANLDVNGGLYFS